MLHLLVISSISLAINGQFSSTGVGSCSRSCLEQSTNSDGNYKFPCSCNSSCTVYRDCCYDSQYQKESLKKHGLYILCLPLSGRGHFSAVGSCPKSWTESSQFCLDGFGHLPPVTSRKTGVTYTNIFCGICNEDLSYFTTWNVKTVCETSGKVVDDGRYVYYRKYLWRVSHDKNSTKTSVPCKYVFDEGQEESLNAFEIRYCRGRELSTCSRTWSDREVSDLCKSYLDPVYIRDKVYRNLHCAGCNYEKEDNAHCIPPIVKTFSDQNMDREGILEYCKKHKLGSCLHYLSFGRGKLYSFSEIFNIDSRMCIPAAGERCCEGYQYDFRRKRCRKLAS